MNTSLINKTLLLVVCAGLSAVLTGCGGAEAQSVSAPAVGGAGDGYSKGVQTIRDVSGASGGTVGNVNTATYAHTVTGVEQLSFEWVGLDVLDNRARRGENVARYMQANKLDIGPTWGAVSEATDTTGLAGSLVSHEFDNFVTGPDNGSRFGQDIVCGDSLFIRLKGRSSVAGCTSAIRIGMVSSTPWATWTDGIEIGGNILGSPIKISDPFGRLVFEVKPNGDVYKLGVKVL